MRRAVDLVAELSAEGRLDESANLELTQLAMRLDEAAVRAERKNDPLGFDLHRLGRAHEAALSSFFTRLAEVVAKSPEAHVRRWLIQPKVSQRVGK